MIIQQTFPKYITYQLSLDNVARAEDLFSAKVNKGLRRDVTRLGAANYKFVRELVNESYLTNKFLPVYQKNIAQKDSPLVIDIKSKVLDHSPHNFPYEAFSLYLNDEFLGGVIFSVREESLNIAFKTFPTKLSFSLGTSVTMLADYHLIQYAIDLKKKHISLGKDRNLYGLHSAIGLAMYKLRLGAVPYVSASADNAFVIEFNWDEKSDVLIFLGKEKGSIINKALLLSTNIQDSQKRYGLLFGQKQCEIEVISRK